VLADFTVNLSDDPGINSDLEALVRSVLEEVSKMFSECPPAGTRPIRVLYCPEGPITDSTTDTTVYRIGLSVCERSYSQLVFQLGHELCHVFADPRRTNWFVESCCAMVSLMLLRRLSMPLGIPPSPHWVSCARSFEAYADARIQHATATVLGSDSLPDQPQLSEWLTTVSDSFREDPLNRPRNIIIAEMLRPFFEESVENWDALRFLGKACSSPPATLDDPNLYSDFEFERWLEAVPEHLKDLVRRISDVCEDRTPPSNG